MWHRQWKKKKKKLLKSTLQDFVLPSVSELMFSFRTKRQNLDFIALLQVLTLEHKTLKLYLISVLCWRGGHFWRLG